MIRYFVIIFIFVKISLYSDYITVEREVIYAVEDEESSLEQNNKNIVEGESSVFIEEIPSNQNTQNISQTLEPVSVQLQMEANKSSNISNIANKELKMVKVPDNQTHIVIEPQKNIETVSSETKIQNQENKNGAINVIKYINPQMNHIKLLGSEKNKVDFWQILDIAMQKSASIILKKHDIKITEANLKILKSEYYPNISLTYFSEYYHGFSRNGSANIGGSVYPSTSEYKNSFNLNLDYEIFRFGAKELKQKIGQTDMELIKSDIELEREKIAKELLENYTVALKAQETIKNKKRILLIKNTLLDNTQRLYEAGFVSKMDITKLRMDEVAIEKDILLARLKILDSMKNIHILSNVDLDMNQYTLAMLNPIDGAIKDFESTALSKNLKLQIEKKIHEIELIKKDYFPTLYAKGSYQIYGSDKNNYFDAIGELERNNWNVGLTLKWDIFNGFKTDYTIEKAKLEIEKLVQQYRLEKITFEARASKRELLKKMISKILSEEGVLLDEIGQQKELLSRLQKSGNVSIMEVDKTEVARLESELDFKLEVIDQVKEDILSQLTM